jgi:hypothetical protein
LLYVHLLERDVMDIKPDSTRVPESKHRRRRIQRDYLR